MGLAVMAKRKRPIPQEPEPGPRTIAITIKGSPAWKEWVDRGAAYCRTDVAKLVDAALVDYLKARGFDETAPER
jgi:hypothetical protein